MNLPEPYMTVKITYKASVHVPDKYYGHVENMIVTRKAFYTNSDGYYNRKNEWIETPNGFFHVPQYWAPFTFSDGTTAMLPDTFYSYGRVMPSNIISWECDKSDE